MATGFSRLSLERGKLWNWQQLERIALWSALTTSNSCKKQQKVHSYGHHFAPQSDQTPPNRGKTCHDQQQGGGGPPPTPKSHSEQSTPHSPDAIPREREGDEPAAPRGA